MPCATWSATASTAWTSTRWPWSCARWRCGWRRWSRASRSASWTSNIQCGNSLIGATPALLDEGIPDEAFKPITGDDKDVLSASGRSATRRSAKGSWACSAATRRGSGWATWPTPWPALEAMRRRDAGRRAARRRQRTPNWCAPATIEYGRLWADAWCAAFVWPKHDGDRLPHHRERLPRH